MRKLWIPLALGLLLVAAVFGALQIARGQAAASTVDEVIINQETQGENTRTLSGPETRAPDEPTISFIDSPTAACIQPDPGKDECFINWYYMSVSASPSYIISMTATLNEFGYVARYHGFFQTSMYAPYDMNPRGYKVACGAPDTGGDPLLGKSYPYTIRARDSAGLKSANYGTVYCPPYTP
jgi:hypothetical protein